MTLEPRQLNDADNDILDFMAEEDDRVNPSYVAKETGHSRPYVSQRLKRMKEHGHVRQPHRGLWELVDDPRDETSSDGGFFQEVPEVGCSECGMPMQKVRSDVSQIATLARMECVSCDATGTVEIRPDESVAQETGIIYHGAAQERDIDE
ncbi:helix-turn-helix transcriptional regulator [Natrialba aegyptia]|uniref:helix-turn-helix transcriptional regulator n=1 Tax=Natrialba aegyptia TaxID=129789 RepID=UPI00403A88B7